MQIIHDKSRNEVSERSATGAMMGISVSDEISVSGSSFERDRE